MMLQNDGKIINLRTDKTKNFAIISWARDSETIYLAASCSSGDGNCLYTFEVSDKDWSEASDEYGAKIKITRY